jgi:hypothetical protein
VAHLALSPTFGPGLNFSNFSKRKQNVKRAPSASLQESPGVGSQLFRLFFLQLPFKVIQYIFENFIKVSWFKLVDITTCGIR